MNTNIHFLLYLAQLSLEWEMFHTKIVEKIKTHILCSKTFFSENHAVYKIMWRNIVASDRRKCKACWITKVTDTLRICITSCFSTATIDARTRLNDSLHVHCLSLINLSLLNSANEREKFTGTRKSEVEPGPDYFPHVFVTLDGTIIRRLFPFIPSPSHSWTRESVFSIYY
jgi:hypothetical protein